MRRRATARRPRFGLRSEVLILFPVAVLLLVVLSTFTLFAYRSAIGLLAEERRAEAAQVAGAVAERLARRAALAGKEEPVEAGWLRELAPAARGVAVLDAAGAAVAAAGDVPQDGLLAPLAGQRLDRPLGVGPDELVPDGVVGFAPAQTAAGRRIVRIDLAAPLLAGQRRALAPLSVVVLAVNSALALLVLLFLRRVLQPYDTLLARARQLGAPGHEDEVEFLLASFDRAIEALAGRDGRRVEDDIAALERTLSASLKSGLLLLDRDGRVLALNAVGAALLGAAVAAPPNQIAAVAPPPNQIAAVAPPPDQIAAVAPPPDPSATSVARSDQSAAPAPPPGEPAALADLLSGQPAFLALLTAAVAEGRALKREECAVASPGGELTVGLTVHPLRRDDGGVRGYLVLFADLTEARRRAEESRLAESLASLGELAGGVAHELRNGLATLRGYVTLIERHPDEESAAGFLGEIRRESDHLQRVVEDFLSFARPGTARLEDLSLAEVVLRAAADPVLAGVGLEVRQPLPAVRLRGDPGLLLRALRNLLHNAAEAEREAGGSGPVEVGAEVTPEGVEVTIDDRGRGVDPELRDRLFHPFATGRAGGVGLGLALAQRIVVLHHGRIWLEDREGGGTRARISFPRDTFVTELPASPPDEGALHLASGPETQR